MFTGLVQHIGRVSGIERRAKGLRLVVDPGRWRYRKIARAGDSVSVAGVCLTVVRDLGKTGGVFEFDVVAETLDKTRLGGLRVGDAVNLEHAATMGTLLGGHLVQGHVDGVGRVARVKRGGDWRVCVDGVSLTVAGVRETGFSVALIPETLRATTLGELEVGDRVNLEMDVIAKMVEALGRKRKAKSEKRRVRARAR